jgi:hypothetical protein
VKMGASAREDTLPMIWRLLAQTEKEETRRPHRSSSSPSGGCEAKTQPPVQAKRFLDAGAYTGTACPARSAPARRCRRWTSHGSLCVRTSRARSRRACPSRRATSTISGSLSCAPGCPSFRNCRSRECGLVTQPSFKMVSMTLVGVALSTLLASVSVVVPTFRTLTRAPADTETTAKPVAWCWVVDVFAEIAIVPGTIVPPTTS